MVLKNRRKILILFFVVFATSTKAETAETSPISGRFKYIQIIPKQIYCVISVIFIVNRQYFLLFFKETSDANDVEETNEQKVVLTVGSAFRRTYGYVPKGKYQSDWEGGSEILHKCFFIILIIFCSY